MAANDQGGRGARSGFVGRVRQLEVLNELANDALAGAGALGLVAGEPGMGKTRLLAEAVRRAEVAGLAVRWATCWEGEGSPAYWPWIQLLRAQLADASSGDVGRDRGPGVPELVRLLPELAQDEHVETGADGSESNQLRFRLFDAVSSLFRSASASRPMVLVVDDLHWCDVGSALLLRFLQPALRSSGILVLGALRDTEIDPASDVGSLLDGLRAGARVLRLDPFDEDEVRELLVPAIGPHEAARLATEVRRRGGGNPLFVQELGQLLAGGERPGLGGTPTMPETIRAVLQRRIARLSSECAVVLRVAGTVGEEFSTEVVEQAAALPRRELLDHLEQAHRAGVIDPTDPALVRFRFVHALLRDVLYEQLSLGARAETHRRVGEALEKAGRGDPPLGELAFHFLRAAPLDGPARGIEYSERAGHDALSRLGFEDAAGHFSRALAMLAPEDDDERRARLSLALGTASMRAGDVAVAKGAFEATAVLARRHHQAQWLAEAALGFGAGLDAFEVHLLDQAQIDMLEEALTVLPEDEVGLRASVMARLAIALTYVSEGRRQQMAEEALVLARRHGDDATVAHALGAHCDAIAGPEHSEQRLAEAEEMVRLAERSRQRGFELLARRHCLVARLELGDVAGADAELEAYERIARDRHQPLYLSYALAWRAMRALLEGRLEDSRRLSDEALHLGEAAHSHNIALLTMMLCHQRLADEGRFLEAADVVGREIESVAGTWGESIWVALIAPAEFPQEARAALDRVVATDFAELPRDANWLGGMTGWIAESCATVRHVQAAEKAYDLLQPYGDRFAVEGIAALCHGSVSRHLGLLASVLDRHEAAAAHYEDAIMANRRAGAVVPLAHTLRSYGAMLLERGDREGGDARLRDSLALYERIGMDVRADQVKTMLASHAPSTENAFRRDGDYWTLAFSGRTTRLRDAKGLRDIAALLARPGRETHVADLIATSAPGSALPRPSPEARNRGEAADPLLDDRARAAYRARLEELRDELEEAEGFSDLARAERARSEMDFLAGELAAALGLGGRARQTANPAERARKAVAQRVRNALRRIEGVHPELARHLDRSLRMGRFCSYRPEQPTPWNL